MNKYKYQSRGVSGYVIAKNMKNACKIAIATQLPQKMDKYDKKVIYLFAMKITKVKTKKKKK